MTAAAWQIAFAAAVQQQQAGDHQAAVLSLTEALSGAPEGLRSKILSLRAFRLFDSFRHYDAYVDAIAALAIDPADVQALNVRMIVAKECGDLERARAGIIELASRVSEPELARQQAMLEKRIQSLISYQAPERQPVYVSSGLTFQAATINDIPALLSNYFDGWPVTAEFIQEAASQVLSREASRKGSVRYLDDIAKLTVTGNMNGDLPALFKIFESVGYPTADNPYLFNGNLTGEQSSVDLVVILIIAKALDDRAVHFNRGPLDTPKMLRVNQFETQACEQYGPAVGRLFISLLTESPVITVVNRSICILHGGLPGALTLPEVAEGSFWGETSDEPGVHRSEGTAYYTFGPDVTRAFAEANGFSLVIRSGQPVPVTGFVEQHDGLLLTVASRFMTAEGAIAQIVGTTVEKRTLRLLPERKCVVHHGGRNVRLNGIFGRLRREFGKNIGAMGIVKVLSTGPRDFELVEPYYVIETQYTFGYMSTPAPGVGLVFIVPGLTITVEAYTIESAMLNRGNDHMKTWQLLGSNDGKDWNLIDERKDTTELNGPLGTGTYHVSEPRPWKIILLKQNEPNHRGNWNICLNHFDIFGTLAS